MKNRILYILISLLAVAGCEYTFDLDGRLDSGRKLFFQCIAGGEDTTIVRIYKTSPSTAPVNFVKETVVNPDGSEYTYDRIIENTIEDNILPDAVHSVVLTANGVRVDLRPAEGGVPQGCLYTLHKFAPGDKLEMNAGFEGIGTISAAAEVPSKFALVDVKRRLETNMEGYKNLRHTITYEGSGEEDVFGVIVLWHRRSETFYEDYVEYSGEPQWIINEDGEMEMIGVEERHVKDTTIVRDWIREMYATQSDMSMDVQYSGIMPFQLYGRNINFWKDKGATGGQRQLTFRTQADNMVELKNSIVTNSYKYIFFRFTPETFRYIRALTSIHNDTGLSALGLAPASYSYSNILGGAGLLGAYSTLETDWETE